MQKANSVPAAAVSAAPLLAGAAALAPPTVARGSAARGLGW